MKTRESGMPQEGMWKGFFEPEAVLAKLGLTAGRKDVADFGCGYGTFTIPAARRVSGTVYALDIDPEMVRVTEEKAKTASLPNVQACVRDFVAEGTGLPAASVDYAMLFNILHAECPNVLLEEAFRILKAGGLLGIVHWNYDPATPRGPSMDIRPRPRQCWDWAERAGFRPLQGDTIDLPPYHYGMAFERPAAQEVSAHVTATREQVSQSHL